MMSQVQSHPLLNIDYDPTNTGIARVTLTLGGDTRGS